MKESTEQRAKVLPTHASGFTLAAAVDEAALHLPVFLGLPLGALLGTSEDLIPAGSSGKAEGPRLVRPRN